jgi:hypothetical protein
MMPKFFTEPPLLYKRYSIHPLYQTWRSMLSRCENPNSADYENYAARGISVCERWHDFPSFVQDMGEKPSAKHTLERRDNDGNYEPLNCVWATRSDQNRNRRKYKIKR